MMFLFLILIHLWHDYKKLFQANQKYSNPRPFIRFSCDCLLLKGVSDFFEFQGFLSSVAAENDFFRIFQPDLMRATRNQILILYTPWALQYDWSHQCIQGTKMWCEQHYKMRTRCHDASVRCVRQLAGNQGAALLLTQKIRQHWKNQHLLFLE